MPDAVAEGGVVPVKLAVQNLGVGVQQQLVGVEAMARLRLVGAMHAVAVVLPRANVVQVAVPDLVGVLRQGDALQLAAAGAVEEAELDLLGKIGRASCRDRVCQYV